MTLLKIMPICIVLGTACSSLKELTGNNPIIDTQGVNINQYNRDLAECRAYADEVEIARKAAAGAATGAVVGWLIGAAVGNSDTAQRGAGVGAVGGGARGIGEGIQERDRVINRCLIVRGYRVLN